MREKAEIKNQLMIQTENKFNEALSVNNFAIDRIFYKVDNTLRTKVISEANSVVVHKYIGELLYYQSSYYEQLLVNLGIEFKLRCYTLHTQDRLLNVCNIDEAIGQRLLIEEFHERIKFALATPLIDMYYNITYGDEETTENARNMIMSISKNFINVLLTTIFWNVREMVYRERITKETKNTLSFIYHSFYLENLEYQMINNLDEVFSVIHNQDDGPWSEEEMNVYDFLLNLGYCFASPKTDPLKAFYG